MRHLRIITLLLLLPGIANSTIFNIVADPASQPIISNVSQETIPPGGNFTMYKVSDTTGQLTITVPGGTEPLPSTNDILGTFDDSKICSTSSCTDIAMTLASSRPTEFAGAFWTAHDIRVFSPGTYSVETCPPPLTDTGTDLVAVDGSNKCQGDTDITFTVEAGQLGAHILFDWSGNNNIDVVTIWNINGTFTRINPQEGNTELAFPAFSQTVTFEDLIPENTRSYSLASTNSAYQLGITNIAADGIPGIPMADGPFKNFRANFSLFLDQQLVPPAPTITATPSNQGVIDVTEVSITIDSGIAPGTGISYDWGQSDAALLAVATGGTTNSTLVIDPRSFVNFESLSASVTVTNATGLSGSVSTLFSMGCSAINLTGDLDGDGVLDNDSTELCGDDDGDGIVNYLDPITAQVTEITVLLGGEAAVVSAGNLALGELAKNIATGGYLSVGIAVTAADIGLVDNTANASCVGGCFDFVVSALGGAGSVQIVLPLSVAIPENPVYKKFTNGTWKRYQLDANNKVDSAAKVAGSCPAPGSADYTDQGLVTGNECVQLTIEDNGPNDSDNAVDTIADPSGVTQATVVITPPLETQIDGGSLGFYSLLMMIVSLSFRRKNFK